MPLPSYENITVHFRHHKDNTYHVYYKTQKWGFIIVINDAAQYYDQADIVDYGPINIKRDFERFYKQRFNKDLRVWIVYSSCVFAITAAC